METSDVARLWSAPPSHPLEGGLLTPRDLVGGGAAARAAIERASRDFAEARGCLLGQLGVEGIEAFACGRLELVQPRRAGIEHHEQDRVQVLQGSPVRRNHDSVAPVHGHRRGEREGGAMQQPVRGSEDRDALSVTRAAVGLERGVVRRAMGGAVR